VFGYFICCGGDERENECKSNRKGENKFRLCNILQLELWEPLSSPAVVVVVVTRASM